jgi:type II secretory pathway component PulC
MSRNWKEQLKGYRFFPEKETTVFVKIIVKSSEIVIYSSSNDVGKGT